MKILFTLFVLLFSSSVVADVGDVYYCETNKIIRITENETKEYPQQKFKFKKEENFIKFNEGGYFDNITIELNIQEEEFFTSREKFETLIYNDGYFMHSSIVNNDKKKDVVNVFATCDIF